jgi:predicted NACHT family NTPase
MVKRSLKASQQGIIIAKKAFERRQWTQEYLAAEVGLYTRNSIWKFFTGRPVDRNVFREICFKLDLEWEEIADLPDFKDRVDDDINQQLEESATREIKSEDKIDLEINKIRNQIKGQIQAQCATIQSWFHGSQPLPLDKVYTNLKVITSISSQKWLEISDLSSLKEPTIPILDVVKNYQRLVIFGKPGSGKTIFLQHLALLCIEGKFKADYLPIFIPIKYFLLQAKQREDFSLLNYLKQYTQLAGILPETIDTLVVKGKILILLDGLEEIAFENSQLILAHLQQFTDFYHQCSIIITCRLGFPLNILRNFTYVELADLEKNQVQELAKKWFVAENPKSEKEGLTNYAQFWEQLQRPGNNLVEELSKTPILLSLLCSVFEQKARFPTKLSKLYQEALEILIKAEDNLFLTLKQDQVINLSLEDKILLLSYIAKEGFVQEKLFYEQQELINIIINNLPSLRSLNSPDNRNININNSREKILNAEKILQIFERENGLLIERAKGIYSFSHLTFQEYLTAKNIVETTKFKNNQESELLKLLANKIYNHRWRQIIFLTLEMLTNSDKLVQEIDKEIKVLIKDNTKINNFLASLEEKQKSLNLNYKPEAIQAFYLGLLATKDLNLALALDVNIGSNLSDELALDTALIRALNLSLNLFKNASFEKILELGFALDIEQKFSLSNSFKTELAKLKELLLNQATDTDKLITWWKLNNTNWINKLRNLINKYRLIGKDWDFNESDTAKISAYYEAKLFLANTLARNTR